MSSWHAIERIPARPAVSRILAGLIGTGLLVAAAGCGDGMGEDEAEPSSHPAAWILSMGLGGVPANGSSVNARFSGSGRYLVFESDASNLVPDDTNGVRDVFVVDLRTGIIERVSTASDGTQPDGPSRDADISADGMTVVFGSEATNLVAGAGTGSHQVFVKHRRSGSTERVASDPSGTVAFSYSESARISADGRRVVFASGSDAWVKDLQTGRLERASVSASGLANEGSYVEDPRISADGRWVLFTSFAENLVPGDSHHNRDLFLKDMIGGALVRVSTNAAGQENGADNAESFLSADGSQVLFSTWARNMVPGFRGPSIVLKDVASGAVRLVTASAEGEPGEWGGRDGSLSADGRYAAFTSQSTRLVPGDDAALYLDLFVKDLRTGAIVRIDDQSVHGSNVYYSRAHMARFSPNGNWLVLHSHYDAVADNDTNGFADVILMRNPFRPLRNR